MPSASGVFLCFDFGTQYIGVAIGHRLTQSARPLVTLPCRKGLPWETFRALIVQWRPEGLVVGHPITLQGIAETIANKAAQFSADLAARYALPVHLADESFTTQLAKSASKSQNRVDAMAAALILEGWLKS